LTLFETAPCFGSSREESVGLTAARRKVGCGDLLEEMAQDVPKIAIRAVVAKAFASSFFPQGAIPLAVELDDPEHPTIGEKVAPDVPRASEFN
jgi:hypothetical protein